MNLGNIVYDLSYLGAIIIVGTTVMIGLHNLVEIGYWRYVDWKYKDKE